MYVTVRVNQYEEEIELRGRDGDAWKKRMEGCEPEKNLNFNIF